jgi:hypothetical protein
MILTRVLSGKVRVLYFSGSSEPLLSEDCSL